MRSGITLYLSPFMGTRMRNYTRWLLENDYYCLSDKEIAKHASILISRGGLVFSSTWCFTVNRSTEIELMHFLQMDSGPDNLG